MAWHEVIPSVSESHIILFKNIYLKIQKNMKNSFSFENVLYNNNNNSCIYKAPKSDMSL